MRTETAIERLEAPDATSDESLIAQFRAGDRDAFGVLYNRYWQRIRSVLRRFVEQEADVDDLTQDVFLKALAALPRFRGDSLFFSWLYRIALTTGINFKNRNPSARCDSTDTFEPTTNIGPERLWTVARRQQTAMTAISRLSGPLREALVLNTIRGFDYEGVSDLAGCPKGTVRSRISRARSMVSAAVAD